MFATGAEREGERQAQKWVGFATRAECLPTVYRDVVEFSIAAKLGAVAGLPR